MSTVHEDQQLTEDLVVYELRHAIAGFKAVVAELYKADLDQWERVQALLADTQLLYVEFMNELRRLESKDMELTQKDRLFNRVTSGPGGNGYGGWSG